MCERVWLNERMCGDEVVVVMSKMAGATKETGQRCWADGRGGLRPVDRVTIERSGIDGGTSPRKPADQRIELKLSSQKLLLV